MDYGLSNLNGLMVFGKYDIAALVWLCKEVREARRLVNEYSR